MTCFLNDYACSESNYHICTSVYIFIPISQSTCGLSVYLGYVLIFMAMPRYFTSEPIYEF